MYKLLTKKELAERWQVTETTIDNWRREGIISECKGVPVVRFNLEQISKLEGIELTKFSPLEKKRLEKELEEIRTQLSCKEKEILELKETLYKMVSIGSVKIYQSKQVI